MLQRKMGEKTKGTWGRGLRLTLGHQTRSFLSAVPVVPEGIGNRLLPLGTVPDVDCTGHVHSANATQRPFALRKGCWSSEPTQY